MVLHLWKRAARFDDTRVKVRSDVQSSRYSALAQCAGFVPGEVGNGGYERVEEG